MSVRDLTYTYRGQEKPALAGVNLEVAEGEFVVVMGHSGSGKTTLVKHFNGLLEPTEGSVRVGEEETVRQGIRRLGQRVGYVFQNPDHQIFSDTVFDEVAFGPKIREMEDSEIEERGKEALRAVGLGVYEQGFAAAGFNPETVGNVGSLSIGLGLTRSSSSSPASCSAGASRLRPPKRRQTG